jgi:hypothetical protein
MLIDFDGTFSNLDLTLSRKYMFLNFSKNTHLFLIVLALLFLLQRKHFFLILRRHCSIDSKMSQCRTSQMSEARSWFVGGQQMDDFVEFQS